MFQIFILYSIVLKKEKVISLPLDGFTTGLLKRDEGVEKAEFKVVTGFFGVVSRRALYLIFRMFQIFKYDSKVSNSTD